MSAVEPEARIDEALAYLDKTVDNVEGLSISWRNDEVIALLVDLRALLTTGALPTTVEVDITPRVPSIREQLARRSRPRGAAL